MLNKIFRILSYLYLMGLSWTLFRIKYEIKKRTGFFDKKNNGILKKTKSFDYSKTNLPLLSFINKTELFSNDIVERADEAINGKIHAFSSQYFDYNDNGKINWHLNPINKHKANSNIEWNKLPDFGAFGDIKLIWEASRFPQIFHFILAYQQTNNKKYALAALAQIENWIDDNPYPFGVNYKCGQEITIRLIACLHAISVFNEFISEKLKKKILKNYYISFLRIESNIDYAAKSVKNNHSISEASGLLIGGLLFKGFPESNKWLKKAVKYLKTELNYQVYNDGSYIQHSMTYQRLVLDMLSFIILLSKSNNYKLPNIVYESHKKMIVFLHSFVQENGYLPNYGSNDGANLFPLAISNYRDFRPSINLASALAFGGYIYNQGKELLDFFNIQTKQINVKKKKNFDIGGYYILKNNDIFVFIRCHSYKHRPSHNDMLHVDIWYKGKNIFCDSGTYSYNTDKLLKSSFTGVKAHNTIQINDEEYMQPVLNFGLSNWTKSKLISFSDNAFVGEHYAYKKKYGITIKRKIEIEDSKITIVDGIIGINNKVSIKQYWNTAEKLASDKKLIQLNNCTINSDTEQSIEKSYCSEYYNNYNEINRIIFKKQTDKNTQIKTIIKFK